MSSTKAVGVIGMGIIGQRVAACLRAAEFTVYVSSRTPRPVPNFLGSPAQIAEYCRVIQIFVRNDADLLETVNLLREGPLGPGHVVVNSATVSPEAAVEAGRRLGECGAKFLNAPFTGSLKAAENGALVYFVGGSPEVLKKARPVLAASAKEIIPVGDIAQAAVVKLANNLLIAVQVQGMAEALALVERAGLDKAEFQRAMESSAARSPAMDMKMRNMVEGTYEPHFSLSNMHKDAEFAQRLAVEMGLTLPSLDAATAVMKEALREGWGEEDFSVIARNFLSAKSSDSDKAVEITLEAETAA